MAQWMFVEWLLAWLLETTVFDFEWDAGNRTKSRTKHDVSIEEVKVCFVRNEPSLWVFKWRRRSQSSGAA